MGAHTSSQLSAREPALEKLPDGGHRGRLEGPVELLGLLLLRLIWEVTPTILLHVEPPRPEVKIVL